MAARIVCRLFQDHLFVTSITFHGGTTVISYPWGSYNRSYKEKSNWISYDSPDVFYLENLAEQLASRAGSEFKRTSNRSWDVKDYDVNY